MRKQLRISAVSAMILILVLSATAAVCAAPAGRRPAEELTLNKLTGRSVADSDAEYQENAALVMYRSNDTGAKRGAENALTAMTEVIGDIEVADVWTFESAAASGSSAMKKSSKEKDPAYDIALVKSKSLSTEELIFSLKAVDDVLYAEPNYRIQACSVNDPYFSYQWSMQDGENTPNVMSVWDEGTTGSNTRIVAVADTGVDYNHPDLKDIMWKNTHYPTLKGTCGYDFIDGDEYPMDENDHGTHCAGIIGAIGNNGTGISGVNQNIRIMALRILDADGSSWLSHEIAAYNYINQALDLGEPVQAINNSWGGGEYSEIFRKLIDIVGKKGAVSVFAAGNDGADLDVEWVYPASLDSPYMIRVAATKEDGRLANFSNYGKETVDVAAPGTDILSTVAHYCYNPTIYTDEKQAEVSAEFNDFETDGGWGSISYMTENLYLNGEKYDSDTGDQIITITRSTDAAFNIKGEDDAYGILIEAENLEKNDLIAIPLFYTISEETSEAPSFSIMFTGEASQEDGSGLFGFFEVPEDTELSLDALGNIDLGGGAYVNYDGFNGGWVHMSNQTMDAGYLAETKEQNELNRKIILVIAAYEDGDYKVALDDMGLSKENLDHELFEKYDFMRGTSMATPFITGAVALYAEHIEYPVLSDPEVLISKIVSMAKDTYPDPEPLPIIMKGSFDFTKKAAEPGPRIRDIVVDITADTITINGTGLDPEGSGLTVEIGLTGGEKKTATVISQDGNQIAVQDEGWINNVVDICITGAGGIKAVRNELYLVCGKKEYSVAAELEYEPDVAAMATDGTYIYVADCNTLSILKLDTQDLSAGPETLKALDPGEFDGLFENNYENAEYDMGFGADLAYMDGKLYNVVEYGLCDEAEYDPDHYDGGLITFYSSEFRLISIDTETGDFTDLGTLPEDLNRRSDFAMAAYNGKLYFIGGFDYSSYALSAAVKVFDPENSPEDRWSDGDPMPEARAGGKALQTGSVLVYTLGYADEDDPVCATNLIYDGSAWTVSSIGGDECIRPHEGFQPGDISIGAADDGLVYMGAAAMDYGDTFIYNVSSDSFADTGYNYIQVLDESCICCGIVAGGTIYGIDGSMIVAAPLTEAAATSITSAKNVTVEGDPACQAEISCAPGASVTVYGARYSADDRFLSMEVKVLTPGKVNEFTVAYEGADTIRIYALDASRAPVCQSASVNASDPD